MIKRRFLSQREIALKRQQKIRTFALNRIKRRKIKEGQCQPSPPSANLFSFSSSESSSSSASSESTAFWNSLTPPTRPVATPVEVIDIDLVFPVPAFIYVKPRQILPKRVKPSITLKSGIVIEQI